MFICVQQQDREKEGGQVVDGPGDKVRSVAAAMRLEPVCRVIGTPEVAVSGRVRSPFEGRMEPVGPLAKQVPPW
jgi:hypothetical protein